MDEWEIRQDERKHILQDLVYEILDHENEPGWKMNSLVINKVIKKRGRMLPTRIEKLHGWCANTANTESATYENIRRAWDKINELVEDVNELNMRFGEKWA